MTDDRDIPGPEDLEDDAVWERFGELGDVPWSDLEPAARALVALGGLRAEVNNGGFDQYFFNPAGDHAWSAVELLAQAGLGDVSDLLARAIAVLGASGPVDRAGRQRLLERVPERAFAPLDDAFYDLEGDVLDAVMGELARRTLPVEGPRRPTGSPTSVPRPVHGSDPALSLRSDAADGDPARPRGRNETRDGRNLRRR